MIATRTSKSKQYLGKAGHLLVMSEFLYRGWNVAIPEVDVGDDIFVVKDSAGTLFKVQVKTGIAKQKGATNYECSYSLKKSQLVEPKEPEITYVFVVRFGDEWGPYLIFSRDVLYELFEENSKASANSISIKIHYKKEIELWGKDITKYKNNWENFPIINH